MSLAPYPSHARSLPLGPMRPFSVREYERMIETGVLGEDDPVELLEGWIVFKMTRNPPHDVAVALASELLIRLLPAGWHVRSQSAITTPDSVPEPDLAVVRGNQRDYAARHPGPADVALAIEVADTSLGRDRSDKARVYARGGIPAYWIVNLIDGVVEVYTDPSGPASGADYRKCAAFPRGQSIPLEVAARRFQIQVNDLLP